MIYSEDFRKDSRVFSIIEKIKATVSRQWKIMEVCGGQTHAIARYRLEELLPQEIELLHGPGCPVCITPASTIDQAIELASRPNVILATFGDMMRVPGSTDDLFSIKAKGADIRLLYSPLDAIALAKNNPDKEIVFFAIGFETTIPVHLTALREAIRQQIPNFSLLTSFFAVPPIMEALLADEGCTINAFLAAGHVCAVTGYRDYHSIAYHYETPIIITGFEPTDILYGIYMAVNQLENNMAVVENAYSRIVSEEGNNGMLAMMNDMLEPATSVLRGIGPIPFSGLKLRSGYCQYDAAYKFSIGAKDDFKPTDQCIAGDIMKGQKQVKDCQFFNNQCCPEHPVGAPMVSSEGVCAAYYKYVI